MCHSIKTIVSALHRLGNEHQILLGTGNDWTIIMKVGVHLLKAAEMLRFIKREEVIQDLKHCRIPRSGGIRNTMTGDHWAVLRPLINAIQVPAEVPAEQTGVPAEWTGESQVYEESVSSSRLQMSPPMSPPMSSRWLTCF